MCTLQGEASASQVAKKPQEPLGVCVENDLLSGIEQDGNIRGLLLWFAEAQISPAHLPSSPQLSEKSRSTGQQCAGTCTSWSHSSKMEVSRC